MRFLSSLVQFEKADLENCLNKIELIDFHQTKEVKGIKFTGYAAGTASVCNFAHFTLEVLI